MHVLRSILAPDETVILQQRQHWLVLLTSFTRTLLLVIIFTVAEHNLRHRPLPTGVFAPPPLIVNAAVWVLWATQAGNGLLFLIDLVAWWRTRFILTTQRVLHVTGILHTYMRSAAIQQINDVLLYQTLVGRMLNYGDVEIVTMGTIGNIRLRSMTAPLHFGQMLQAERASSRDATAHALENERAMKRNALHSQKIILGSELRGTL